MWSWMVVVSSYHEMLSHYVPAPQLVRPQSSLQAGCYFQGLAAPKSTDYKDSSAFFFFLMDVGGVSLWCVPGVT